MARPTAKLPDNEIAYRGRSGEGAPAIHAALKGRGIAVDERTVGRRLEKLRAGGWPGADAFAATVRPKKPARPAQAKQAVVPADAEPAEQAEDAGGDELTLDDIERLPAELLADAGRDAMRAFKAAVKEGNPPLADKLASIIDRFAVRLVEVRPPEKVEPVKDPTNIAARREVLARWEQLREPHEIALPVIEAMEAHACRLRSKLERGAGAAPAT